jgi:hypothetical protein
VRVADFSTVGEFERDDRLARDSWTWTELFDFIFCRIRDDRFDMRWIAKQGFLCVFHIQYRGMIANRIHRSLEPGGVMEIQGMSLSVQCEDEDCQVRALLEEGQVSRETALSHHDLLVDAGFQYVRLKEWLWPLHLFSQRSSGRFLLHRAKSVPVEQEDEDWYRSLEAEIEFSRCSGSMIA